MSIDNNETIPINEGDTLLVLYNNIYSNLNSAEPTIACALHSFLKLESRLPACDPSD